MVVIKDYHFGPLSQGDACCFLHPGNIDHGKIHADIADDRRRFPVDEYFSFPVTQAPVQPVGVTHRQHGNDFVFIRFPFAVIPYRVACRNVFDLDDHGTQGAHVAEFALFILVATDTIQSDTQSDHVEPGFGKTAGSGRIEDVPEDRVIEMAYYSLAHGIEQGNLLPRKRIFCRIFTGCKMRKDRLHLQCRVHFKPVDQQFDFLLLKTQPVHPAVEFDMNPYRFLDGSLVSDHRFFQ